MRDYATEMRDLIKDETCCEPYDARILAHSIVEKLRKEDQELLNGWLMLSAEDHVHEMIVAYDRSRRSLSRSPARQFGEAVQAHENGDSEPLRRRFLDDRCYMEDGLRKKLAELVYTEVKFVADGYANRAKQEAMNQVFMEAIAKKIRRGGTVEEHFDEATLVKLWDSLSV